MIWHTHSERAGTFTSAAVSNWEVVMTTFNGKTMITARGPETKASEADFPADAEFFCQGPLLSFAFHLQKRRF
jgi:hypothetical protein